MYDVYDESNRYSPHCIAKFYYLEDAKDYVRNAFVERIWREDDDYTLVVRLDKRLVFLHTNEHSDLSFLKPGGMSKRHSTYEDGGALMIGMPGMGSCGYSSDALVVRHPHDRSGRTENDKEVKQDHGPQTTTSFCLKWKGTRGQHYRGT